jgi:hypothetical protein
MKIPIIKHLVNFVEANDEDYIHETLEVLESLADVPTIKDEELEVIGELISNLYGAHRGQQRNHKRHAQKRCIERLYEACFRFN